MPWIAEEAERTARHFGVNPAAERRDTDARTADPAGPRHFTRREIRWSRRVPVDTHLAGLASHSALLAGDEERTAAFLAEQRGHLAAAFPDGTVEETYDVVLLLATTPPSPAA